MTDPDATLTITAACVFGRDGAPNVWELWAMPAAGKPQDQRVSLGSGPVGAGILFPVIQLDAFWKGQQG